MNATWRRTTGVILLTMVAVLVVSAGGITGAANRQATPGGGGTPSTGEQASPVASPEPTTVREVTPDAAEVDDTVGDVTGVAPTGPCNQPNIREGVNDEDGGEDGRNLASFLAGLSVLVYGNDAAFPAKSEALLDRLVAMNVNSVALVFPVYQASWTATEVTTDAEQTPSLALMRGFVRAAHARGLSVMLRPTLDEASLHEDDKWRGNIEPRSVEAWFDSYGALIVDYARFAEAEGIEILSIGAELESLEAATAEWTDLIAAVRQVYAGNVTYSFNWGHLETIEFARELDFVGLDAFFPLDRPAGAPAAELVEAWQPWMERICALENATDKPVVLTEIGVRSVAGSYRAPWEFNDDPADQEDQAAYYESLCSFVTSAVVTELGARVYEAPATSAPIVTDVAKGTALTLRGPAERHGTTLWQRVEDPATGIAGYLETRFMYPSRPFHGMYIWSVGVESPLADPRTDADYNPFGKLAEPVIAGCYDLTRSTPEG